MKAIYVICLILLLPLKGAADDLLKYETLTTNSGKTYSKVTVQKATPSYIKILHEGGITTLQFKDLPDPIQKAFEYDPAKAEAYEKQMQAEKTPVDSAPVNRASEGLKRELAIAAAIVNSVERLTAYDNIAAHYGLVKKTSLKKVSAGKWNIRTDTSVIDDSKTVVCSLEADNAVKVGYKTIKPILFIRYKEGELNAYINYGNFLGSGNIDVTLRFGKKPATKATWSTSTDHKAAFVSGSITTFIQRLERVDSLVVRLTPYSESPITVSLSPQGMAGIKKAIRDAAKR
jgi:type VI secretion system protein VasI